MREIKFRAWQKHYKEMYQPHNGWIEFHRGELSVVGFNDGDLQLGPDDVILMQYTGLKDKNGKEIYEGDIVQSYPGIIHKVVYREDIASFVLRKNVGASLQITFDDGNLKVIGNIYENPELLQDPISSNER